MKKKKQKARPAAEVREKLPPAGEETLPSEETEQPSVATRPPFPEEEKSGEQAEKFQELSAEPAEAARQLGTPGRYQTGLPVQRHPLRAALMVLLVLGIAGGTAGFFVLDVPNWQPLDVSRITAAPQTGRMYDGEGQLIMTIKGSQNRVVIPFDDIPEQTRNVFLAAEDLRFYRHHGVDMVRLFGALAANIREGGYSQGASTITMQLIRQSHLSTKKTLSRKAEEIWLAWQLERRMSKDDILAMYLNYIYFGNGAYGIQAAAQTYFGVDARDLTLTQACALAASIKAPSYYAPHVSAQHNRSRRNYILNIMLEEGMIDQQTRDEAAAETLVLAEVLPEKVPYGWYADAVLDEAETLLGMTSEEVLSGGLSIDTALSRTHQDLLDKQFTADIFPANASDGTKVQGAAACVDTNTGEVLAIVGGRSYDVRRGFNRATRLRRQPGSALKPLAVYAPAIDRYGYMTCSVLKDEPTNFNGYKPRNSSYTYYGNVSIRTALKNSLNVSTVALLNQIGVNSGRDYMASVGIPLDDRDANLALGLGAMTYGVSPVQLAAAYAPFGNGGTYNAPHLIRRITDASGRVLYQNRDSGSRVLKATSAYLMTSLLQTVTASGTGAKLSGAGTPVAGKTGTVNMTGGGNRDIWMACYNSELFQGAVPEPGQAAIHPAGRHYCAGDRPAGHQMARRTHAGQRSDPKNLPLHRVLRRGQPSHQKKRRMDAAPGAEQLHRFPQRGGLSRADPSTGGHGSLPGPAGRGGRKFYSNGTIRFRRGDALFHGHAGQSGRSLYIPGDPRSRGAAEQRRFAGGRTVGAGGAGESFHRLLGQCEELFHRRRAEGRRCGGESGGERAVDFLGKLRERMVKTRLSPMKHDAPTEGAEV